MHDIAITIQSAESITEANA